MIEEASLTMERTLKDSMTLQRIEEGLLVPQVKIFRCATTSTTR